MVRRKIGIHHPDKHLLGHTQRSDTYGDRTRLIPKDGYQSQFFGGRIIFGSLALETELPGYLAPRPDSTTRIVSRMMAQSKKGETFLR